ncbi:hypothetical protein ACEWPL_015125 [Roseovarius sp. S1116L3]|uniref:hypothetical protein n=1 Tax=Roseovarius roseus TaxID=3342636 RepID=UPI003729FE53
MGRAKALMMEMEETLWEPSDVSFFCPDCKEDVDGTTELPVVFDDGDGKQLPISLECFNGHQFDGWVNTDWDSCKIELDDHPEIHITADPMRGTSSDYDDYDHDYYEWLEEQEQFSRPVFRAFNQTMEDVGSLTSSIVSDAQSQMLARMLLAQSITALEVFLADTLILTVANSSKAQEKLLSSKSLEIGNKQFKLSDAMGIDDFAKVRLLEYLRAVSFHDIKKANSLFRVGLGIDILPKGADLDLIQKSIKMRHDCVHRNGLDRETGELHQIDQTFLMNLADVILKMATSVDLEVDDFDSPF